MPKCEHGLTSKECYVCASPKHGAKPERHFCERCGKRLSQDGIHTCTPPQQAEPVPTHRINSWGFCGVCRHDRIPGEGCARQECPDSPQQPEPVEPVAWVHTDAQNHRVRFLEWTQQAQGYRGEWIKTPLCNCAQPRQTDPQIEDRLARHGIPKP